MSRIFVFGKFLIVWLHRKHSAEIGILNGGTGASHSGGFAVRRVSGAAGRQ